MLIIFSFPSYRRIILVFILWYVSADLNGAKEASTVGQLSQMLWSSYMQLSYSSQKPVLLSSSLPLAFTIFLTPLPQ